MPKMRVLILCTGNSARSQMAEGLLRHDAGDQFEVESAGTKPGAFGPKRFPRCAVWVSISADIGRSTSMNLMASDSIM